MTDHVNPFSTPPDLLQAMGDLLDRVKAKGGAWSRDDRRLAARYTKQDQEHYASVVADLAAASIPQGAAADDQPQGAAPAAHR